MWISNLIRYIAISVYFDKLWCPIYFDVAFDFELPFGNPKIIQYGTYSELLFEPIKILKNKIKSAVFVCAKYCYDH